MGDTGLFASKYFLNTNSLKQFSAILRHLKNAANSGDDARLTEIEINKLLSILRPLNDALEGNIARSANLDGQGIVEILNQKHSDRWQLYKSQINDITRRLEIGDSINSWQDIDVLEDVADAIDIECGILFRRISGK